MAVHKVPQDVEADDKFLGPLSFKQFIFFGVAMVAGYLTFLTLTKGLWFISIFTFIPFIAAAALAFPWSKEQPTELWLASRIRFFLKPRKRIWDQTGAKELVQITVPKKEVFAMTDGLSQSEVRTRFNALATMIDSRGWAIKNVATAPSASSDRLVQQTAQVQTSSTVVVDEPDIMDESSSTIARQFDNMIQESEQKHKSDTLRLIEEARKQGGQAPAQPMQQPIQKASNTPTANATNAQNQDFWFMHNQPKPADPAYATFQSANVVHPGEEAISTPVVAANVPEPQLDEATLLAMAHEKQRRDALQSGTRHEKVVLPQGQQPVPQAPAAQPPAEPANPVMRTPDPVILDLAKSNDLNIDTLARQAKKNDDGEVVISLH